jgi:two-component system sensor histidine kinase FlrB
MISSGRRNPSDTQPAAQGCLFPGSKCIIFRLRRMVNKGAVLSEDSKQVKAEELEQAFNLFNEVSTQLAGAYQELQQQVEGLTAELAVANGELRRQYLEKEALSQRLGLLLAALPAGVVALSGEGLVEEANPAARAMLGEPLVGEPWATVSARALRPTSTPHDWDLVSSSPERPLRVNVVTSHIDPAGRQIVLLHDVTEAYEMQQELQRHQRLTAMGEMAARLAHQLRTPLATAMLYTSHLTKPVLADADRVRFADKALARLRHLEQLIRDMLSFVKGEAGGREPVEISSLLAELRQVIDPQASQRGLSFALDDRSGGAAVLGHRKELTGMLINLLENAMQACGEGGRVAVRAERSGREVRISVEDNGRGIPEELHERLFEPFFTTRTEGTGLGLAIVRNVVEAHGGRVEMRSAPGEGSEFTVFLPAIE